MPDNFVRHFSFFCVRMTNYLHKHAIYPSQIKASPLPNLNIIIVIPCHDEPDVLSSVQALRDCKPPEGSVEVIVVVNGSEQNTTEIKQQNKLTISQLQQWIPRNTDERFQCFTLYHPDMPAKHAGVGLARKIGMDEAVWRFEKIGNPRGIIACFDADSRCDTNYLQALEQHFTQTDTVACSIYFEHPTNGTKYSEAIYKAIIDYELYLRYYVQALRFAGFPHAYQTIGSSMAVRADAYQRQGGMNRRKAGEDFYFLQKFIPHGHYSELHNTRVIPSPRPSDRVPFGTGKAVGDLIEADTSYLAYHPNVFIDLKTFIQKINTLYDKKSDVEVSEFTDNLPDSIGTFLIQYHFYKKIKEIHQHTSNEITFRQRFFQWFNAFMVLKYVHHARDRYHPSVPVYEVAIWLLREIKTDILQEANTKTLLDIYRKLERKT